MPLLFAFNLYILYSRVGYLSIFGLKTKKFNNQIKKSISKVNNKINFQLNDVYYLLNLKNLSINISTNNSKLSIDDRLIDIKNVKTNISIKSFINNQYSIDDLEISTAEIKIKDLLFLNREVHNSPQLFILSKIIKDGSIEVDASINFDTKGKIKNDYQIKGSIKNARLDLLNQSTIKDLNFLFNLNKNQYLLSKIKTSFNEIKLNSAVLLFKCPAIINKFLVVNFNGILDELKFSKISFQLLFIIKIIF